jgi:hypothetical protein
VTPEIRCVTDTGPSLRLLRPSLQERQPSPGAAAGPSALPSPCLNVLEFHGTERARLMLFNDVSHYAHQQVLACSSYTETALARR